MPSRIILEVPIPIKDGNTSINNIMLKLGNKYEELNEKYDCTGHYKEKLDENFLGVSDADGTSQLGLGTWGWYRHNNSCK